MEVKNELIIIDNTCAKLFLVRHTIIVLSECEDVVDREDLSFLNKQEVIFGDFFRLMP